MKSTTEMITSHGIATEANTEASKRHHSRQENHLIILNATQIATPIGRTGLSGKAMQTIRTYDHHSIIIKDGIIDEITNDPATIQEAIAKGYDVIDAEGKTVLPGYIDSHTHLIFGGYRPEEFDMRLKGVPYMEIMKNGGGIASSVAMTREASLETLILDGRHRINKMMAMGITTMEAKSGYGLDLQTELKQLKAVKALRHITPMTIVSTFLGAHAVPETFKTAEAYIDYVNDSVLPLVKEYDLATFVDIFCEDHVFGIEDSRKHLTTAKALGFKLKMHADEIVPLGGASLAASLGAVSADHLLHISDQGIKDLKERGVVATLLPGTAFTLREAYAPARKIIDEGCMVALASDFNPGSCFTYAVPLIIALATLEMKMTIEETLTALTLNGAAALDMADTIGSIEVGKKADLNIHAFPSYKYISYHVGINTVDKVIKNGKMVIENQSFIK
jgi:imidazolonepropionase